MPKKGSKKGKHLAVLVQLFLPSWAPSGASWAGGGIFAPNSFAGFYFHFLPFSSPCLNPGKKFLGLNTYLSPFKMGPLNHVLWLLLSNQVLKCVTGTELNTYLEILFLKCCCVPKALPTCSKMIPRVLLPVGFHFVVLSCACYKHLD